MTIEIAELQSLDLPAAAQLSSAQGWNQTEVDWRRLLALSPRGCFVAWRDGILLGTVTTISYDTALGWIGMMVVHPEHRRAGIGAALMTAAIGFLQKSGVERIMLDATPAGLPLYERLGFWRCGELERWQRLPRAASSATEDDGESQEIETLDAVAYGVRRRALLERLLAESTCGVPTVRENGNTTAFALARSGQRAMYLGPVVARTSMAAEAVVECALRRLANQPVFIDRHANGLLTNTFLRDRGFALQRTLTRMCLGDVIPLGVSPLISAPAGPEYG